MKLAAWGRWVIVMAGVAAAIAGLVMLLVQADLPGMRDVASFERSVTDLYALAEEDGNFQRASRKFHELREVHDNGKGFLADLGACLLICGMLLAVLAWRLPVSARLRRLILQTHRLWSVALVGVVAACLLGVGASMQALVIFDRFEVPPWADSLAIPMAGSAMLTVFCVRFRACVRGPAALSSAPSWRFVVGRAAQDRRRHPRSADLWPAGAVLCLCGRRHVWRHCVMAAHAGDAAFCMADAACACGRVRLTRND